MKRAVLTLSLMLSLVGSTAWAGGVTQDSKTPPTTNGNTYRPQPTPEPPPPADKQAQGEQAPTLQPELLVENLLKELLDL